MADMTGHPFVAATALHLLPGAKPTVVTYPPGARFGPRTLSDFELVWLLHGSATWHSEGRQQRLLPGSMQLLRPGMTDSYIWDPKRPTRHAYIHFSLRDATGSGWPLVRHLSQDSVLAAMFRHLFWLRSIEPVQGHPRLAEVLRLLLAMYVSDPLPAVSAPELPAAIRVVLDHLRTRWAGGRLFPVPVREMAAAGSVSPSHLSRLFRSQYGVGPATAVELLRLGQAENLLIRTNLPIGTIATQCGFADVYHLSRRFRSAYGIPPRAFRNAGGAAESPGPLTSAGLLPLQQHLWPLA